MTLTLADMSSIPWPYYIAPIGGVIALVMARILTLQVLQRSEGDAEQQSIAAAVRAGAMAYLRRQYKVVTLVFVALVALLGVLSAMGLQPVWSMIGVPLAGFLSALCGWFGMKVATSASARTAAAARQSLNEGLQVAFRAGSVMGLTVVGFAILDVSFWFFLFMAFGDKVGISGGLSEIIAILLSFKVGASLQALFARVGGGIYTKAADVGADLVGKVEAGIPEDDARNPAVIADNVGDNVGDVAGMGADLYESYYSCIIAALALGSAAVLSMHALGQEAQAELAILLATMPLALAGVGILASVAGVFAVRTREDATFSDLLSALNRGIYTAAALIVLASFGVPYILLSGSEAAAAAGVIWWKIGLSIVTGLLAGLVIARWTEYCTSYEHAPTQRIAQQALTGPATVIIAGIAEGMKSTWASLVAVTVAACGSFIFAGGGDNFLLGLYGVGIAAVGMLATLGITLATDAYGPIADNAGGNAEMSGQPPFVRERTDKLDSLGNTTAATGKGFAIGSAALTSLALLAAYVGVVQNQLHTQTTAFAESAEVTNVTGAPDGAYAVYKGYRQFGVVVPAELAGGATVQTGAILVDLGQFDDLGGWHGVKKGQVFEVSLPATVLAASDETIQPTLATARRLELTAAVTKADGTSKNLDFRVITTGNASIKDVLLFYDVTLTDPRVLGGLFMGVMLTFLFCALTMNAVGRAAYSMMNECRRQFAIMRQALRAGGMPEGEIADATNWPKKITADGKEYPDYERCVSISTAQAQREMVTPALLSILVPTIVGLLLGVGGVIGLLAGGLISGFAVAVFMANAGGAWDNAKKLVESYGKIPAKNFVADASIRDRFPTELRQALLVKAEELVRTGRGDAYVYGKGSEDHKATVVGDTVGDPFKDTSGPSLNILIKLISSVSIVVAGLIVLYGPAIGEWLGLG